MRPIDPDIHSTRALIVDGNATSRSVLASQLRDFGVGTVQQSARLADARALLERERFDIVLCEDHFDHGDDRSGQDMLDELRREQLLPYSTVFVMVSGEASYARVSEAAEAALDGYLLKPHSAAALGERLAEARQRKRVLKGLFAALEARDFALAVTLCRERFERREMYWLYAARVGAELHIRLGQPREARELYEAVLRVRPVPWARLGIARAQQLAGAAADALRACEALLAEQPDFADAWDLLGQVQLDQGELNAALDALRKAAELTPGSVTRLQHLGALTFYAGALEQSVPLLERACTVGAKSRLFDASALVLLALLRFDAGDSKALALVHDQLLRRVERDGASARLARFESAVQSLRALLDRRLDAAVGHLRALLADALAADFDLEAAGHALALTARLADREAALGDTDVYITRLATRFCVSRASCDMLLAAAQQREPAATLIRDAHASITAVAERAMGHALAGDPRLAVHTLLDEGEATRNAKLIELAGLATQRHRERIGSDCATLQARSQSLRERYCGAAAQVIGRPRGARAAGGLTLRA